MLLRTCVCASHLARRRISGTHIKGLGPLKGLMPQMEIVRSVESLRGPASWGCLASCTRPREARDALGIRALTNIVHRDGHRFPAHGKEGQRVLVPLSVDERVPSEVNGQNVILGSHTAKVPLDSVIETESQGGYALRHVAIDS